MAEYKNNTKRKAQRKKRQRKKRAEKNMYKNCCIYIIKNNTN